MVALVELVGQALIGVAVTEQLVQVDGVGQERRFGLPVDCVVQVAGPAANVETII